MRTVLSFAALALLAACATDPNTPATLQATAAPEEKVVCGMEEPTGSRLKVRRCWTQDQINQETQDAKKVIERGQIVRPPPNAPGSGR